MVVSSPGKHPLHLIMHNDVYEYKIPGFGAYKAFSILRPVLGMFLPNLFGPKAPQETAKEANDAQDGGQPSESKKQAKLRARAEKGDKRVQQQGQRR